MNEFTKIVAAMKTWGWGRASFLLALFLLAKQFVTFDQAVILILLPPFLEKVVQREKRSSRHRGPGSARALNNSGRRS
jgi:hypothetical protein